MSKVLGFARRIVSVLQVVATVMDLGEVFLLPQVTVARLTDSTPLESDCFMPP